MMIKQIVSAPERKIILLAIPKNKGSKNEPLTPFQNAANPSFRKSPSCLKLI